MPGVRGMFGDWGSRSRRRRAGWPKGPRRRLARRARVRRWAAAVVAAMAVFVAVNALSPRAAGESGLPTVVMVHDVAAGELVGRDDVALERRPGGQRPDSATTSLDEVVGRLAAGTLTAREIVTRERLVGSGVLSGQPGDHVAMSVPVLDVAAVGVRPGSRIDLYATGTGQLAASDTVVLAVREAQGGSGFGATAPPQVTVALSPADATAVARSLSALESGQIFVVAIRHTPNATQ